MPATAALAFGDAVLYLAPAATGGRAFLRLCRGATAHTAFRIR
jgi:hypothetical protein